MFWVRRTCDAATPPISAADFSGRPIPVNAGLWPPPPAACGVDRDPSLRTLAAKSSRQNLCQFSAPRRISADSDRRPQGLGLLCGPIDEGVDCLAADRPQPRFVPGFQPTGDLFGRPSLGESITHEPT